VSGPGRPRCPICPAELEEVYTHLRSARLVAEALGVSQATVYRALERHGIQRFPPGSPVVLDELELIELYRDLGSADAVALKLGVSRGTVLRRLKKVGEEVRMRGRPRQDGPS